MVGAPTLGISQSFQMSQQHTSIGQSYTKESSDSGENGNDRETDGKIHSQREVSLEFLDDTPSA